MHGLNDIPYLLQKLLDQVEMQLKVAGSSLA
jgi:hypothetical protein